MIPAPEKRKVGRSVAPEAPWLAEREGLLTRRVTAVTKRKFGGLSRRRLGRYRRILPWLRWKGRVWRRGGLRALGLGPRSRQPTCPGRTSARRMTWRSEEHTSEL